MLNNQQRHHVNGHGMYPHYPLMPTSQWDFGHVDPVLGAYRQDVQHSLYPASARDEYAHLAPPSLPTQHSALVPSYSASTLRPFEHTLSHRSRRIQRPVYHPVTNAACVSSVMDDEQLARYQHLSAAYEPEVKGPLAGQLQSSNTLVEEYATADPTYQRKTASLASTYSHIRTLRGDGQCGWRAIAYGYFERLLLSHNPNQLIQEETRLRSLVNIVRAAGIAADLYDDFASETYTLLRDLSDSLRNGTASNVLLERLNDEGVQNYIITHLKSLTTAWLKAHADEYVCFMPDLNVEAYCDQKIMPLKSEMEQVSLMALNDVLLGPAGIGLEVEYLDLSPGQQGTLHQLTRVGGSTHLGTVRLLYRPGHYDLLYKSEDLPAPPVAAYLQFSPNARPDPLDDLYNNDFMHLIPGMSGVPPSQTSWANKSHFDMSDIFDLPTSAQPCAPPMLAPPAIASKAPVRSAPQNFYIAPQPAPVFAPPLEPISDDYVIRTSALPSSQHLGSGGPFRMTGWHHKQDTSASQGQLKTAQFRNSHYNPAHFNNPDFQPETWSPEKENARPPDAEPASRNVKARRSR